MAVDSIFCHWRTILLGFLDCIQAGLWARTGWIQLPGHSDSRLQEPEETGPPQRCKSLFGIRQGQTAISRYWEVRQISLHVFALFFYIQKNYRQHIDQVKYSPVTDTPDILLAKKNARLVSNVNHTNPTSSSADCGMQVWLSASFFSAAELQSRLRKDQTPVHALAGSAPDPECQGQCCFVQWCESTACFYDY